MYITVKTIKRNLGFNGIEIADFFIGFPIITFFILLFSLTPFKIFAIILLMIGIFLLLPIHVSKKNRMYKVLILIICYCYRTKNYIYSQRKLEKERKANIDGIRKRFKF